MSIVEESDDENHLKLSYESENKVRIERQWRKVDDSTVRLKDAELMYNYSTEQWEKVHRHIRDYDVDSNDRLVGDGSNWSGEGRLWRDHARKRHVKRVLIRFPWVDEYELLDGDADV